MNRSPFARRISYFVLRAFVHLGSAAFISAVLLRQVEDFGLALALALINALYLSLLIGELRHARVRFDSEGATVPLRGRFEWCTLVETARDANTLILVFQQRHKRRILRVPLGQFQRPANALATLREYAERHGQSGCVDALLSDALKSP